MKTGGEFVPITKVDLWEQHVVAGWDGHIPYLELLSPVDRQILHIQREHHVDFVGALAGRKKGPIRFGDTRCLITSEPTFIVPMERDWAKLEGVLSRMFGPVQLPYVYGWIKVALEMFMSETWIAGQALFIAGPPGAGKNLFGSLLRFIFGGRMPGKPYAYMTGKTNFNADFCGAELLTIEDEAAATTIQARREFGARLKTMTVNDVQWLHGKYKTAVSLVPLWRLLASLNDEPERLLVVPPLDEDIRDKIILLLVEKHPMPMPTQTPKEQATFMSALIEELPGFLHFLSKWEIPESIRSDRFGVTHYHHPKLAGALSSWSPELRLLELIDEFIFTKTFAGPWIGRSADLSRVLKGSSDTDCAREAGQLLPAVNSCGIYLHRLEKSFTDRVSSTLRDGNSIWRIEAPSGHVVVTPSKPNISVALEKMKAAHAAKESKVNAGSENTTV